MTAAEADAALDMLEAIRRAEAAFRAACTPNTRAAAYERLTALRDDYAAILATPAEGEARCRMT